MAKKKPDRLDELVDELLKEQSPEEILSESGALKELKKRFIEKALEGELTGHLGYEKHSTTGRGSGNSRNGRTSKRIIDGEGAMEIDVPRDRNGDFEPQLIRKRQTRPPAWLRRQGDRALQERKAVARDLRAIYTSPTAGAAEQALDTFEEIWGERYPMAAKAWRTRWERVIPFFSYPEPIRKVIYTNNAIESLNAQLRKVTRKRGSFPSEDSIRKVIYLAMSRVAKRWNRPIKNWPAARNYFSIAFAGRLPA